MTVEGGEATKNVTLIVHQGLFIRGRVLWPHPPAGGGGGLVSAWSDQVAFSLNLGSGQESFVLGPLVPGEYQLQAVFPGFVASDAVLGVPGDEDVLLQLESGGSISGRIVGAEGERLDGWIEIVARPDLQGGWGRTTIASDGAFAVYGLAPGTYDLLAATDRGRIGFLRRVIVEEGTESRELRIDLQPSATLRCTAVGDWACVRIYQEDELVGAGYVEPASPSTFHVPAGVSVLRYGSWERDPSEWRGSMRIEVGSGEEREIVLPKESP